MFAGLRYRARGVLQGGADLLVTLPFIRWTWQGSGNASFADTLDEFRPADGQTVHEMMQGRYLFASRLIDTGGASPFAIEADHEGWVEELHGFSWLRHFRATNDSGRRYFARALALDWIGRDGGFGRGAAGTRLCAQRVMNWLRHHTLLVEGATPEQARTITRSLGNQIQALALRARTVRDPLDALFATIALLGGALCTRDGDRQIENRLARLLALLGQQIDGDGLHLGRNGEVQLALLVELISIRRGLARHSLALEERLAPLVETMHKALDALTLGNGEPAYFNGCGNMPHDITVSVQAESVARQRSSRVFSGYGLLVLGPSRVVADGGRVPPIRLAWQATASALGVEFSHGTELVFGSCGPAPEMFADKQVLFRGGITHSAPTVNEVPAGDFIRRGVFRGFLVPRGKEHPVTLDEAEASLVLRTEAYKKPFGIVLERRVSLLAEGTTLVGQDRMVGQASQSVSGTAIVRFHLAPGAQIGRNEDQSLVRVRLANGEIWSFLWEGAAMREEDSLRHSAHLGFHRTRQLVLEAEVAPDNEIAWVFTLNR